MKIAIEGCAHGELEIIYDTIQALEQRQDIKLDLLICCGDFQATRNEQDLQCMAVPPKYYNMCSFYKYYNGDKKAPVPTVFIGGNHEASNHLQELPYGGWVAPNIYYLGYAGVINVGGLRIGGISGIYKGQDYLKGHYEKSPYDNNTKRSVYHIRNLEVFRLKQVIQPIDIFMSHDWPTGIWKHGDYQSLLKFKPYFQNDMDSGKLGSKPCEELLAHLQPKYWFAAHLHCKFGALVAHLETGKNTKFLALDKCLPRRRFLQVIDVPHELNSKIEICYDLEWLSILNLTNHLLSVKGLTTYMPGPNGIGRWKFTPTDEEKLKISSKFPEGLVIPHNFVKTVESYNPQSTTKEHIRQSLPRMNPQTQEFCSKLEIDDPLALLEAYSEEKPDTDSPNSEDDLPGVYETFIKSSSTRFSLSLPDPKNDSQTTACSNLSFESGNCSDIEKEVSQAEKDYTNEIETEKEDTGEESREKSPIIKRFKRRNASIYCNEET